jgi:hypothetical protein
VDVDQAKPRQVQEVGLQDVTVSHDHSQIGLISTQLLEELRGGWRLGLENR